MNKVLGLIGKYELQRPLERGSLAEVWKAFDTRLKRSVALMLLHPDLQVNPDFITRFEREVPVISSLGHHNIVQILDSLVFRPKGSQDLQAYIVMNYVRGPTLADYIRHTSRAGQFPSAADMVHLFTAIGDAIDYAHQRNVIHAGLKPSNILLDDQYLLRNPMGEPKLTDFGIAKMLATSTGKLKSQPGTPLYIAPEQALYYPAGNKLSDIYSLGVILYELCTGKLPFECESASDILMHIISSMPPSPASINPNISQAFSDVILRSLAKDPAERFSKASEMAGALAHALDVPVSENLDWFISLPDNNGMSSLFHPSSPGEQVYIDTSIPSLESMDEPTDQKASWSAPVSPPATTPPSGTDLRQPPRSRRPGKSHQTAVEAPAPIPVPDTPPASALPPPAPKQAITRPATVSAPKPSRIPHASKSDPTPPGAHKQAITRPATVSAPKPSHIPHASKIHPTPPATAQPAVVKPAPTPPRTPRSWILSYFWPIALKPAVEEAAPIPAPESPPAIEAETSQQPAIEEAAPIPAPTPNLPLAPHSRKLGSFRSIVRKPAAEEPVSVLQKHQPGSTRSIAGKVYNVPVVDDLKGEDKQRMQGKRQKARKPYFVVCALLLLLLCTAGSLFSVVEYQTYNAKYHADLFLAREGIQHLQRGVAVIETLQQKPLDAPTVQKAQLEFTASMTIFSQLDNELKSLPEISLSLPTYGARLSAALHLLPIAIEVSQTGVIACNTLNLLISRFHSPLHTQAQGLGKADLSVINQNFQRITTMLNLVIGQVNRLQPGDLQLDPRLNKLVAAFHKEIPALQSQLNVAEKILPLAPTILGIGKPTNYLIEVLDSTQLSPGGGYIDSYGTVTISGGLLTTAHLTDVDLLDDPFEAAGGHIPFPAAYTWFDQAPTWSFRVSNLDADFPTVARYAELTYRKEGGKVPVQGVIALTPAFIERALAVTGPIDVPEYHKTITAQNLVAYTHYFQSGQGKQENLSQPKRFTEVFTAHFLVRLHQLSPSAFLKLWQQMISSLQSKDVQIYLNSSAAEHLLQSYQLDAAIQSPGSDSLFVVDANIGVNQVNNLITNTLNDQVTIDGNGNAVHHTILRYAWALQGQNNGSSSYRDYLRVYAPPGSTLQVQNGWEPRGTSEAFGREVWAGFFTLSSGQTRTITLVWTVPGAAKKGVGGWDYRYTIQRQAGAQWMLHLQVTLPSCAGRITKLGGLLPSSPRAMTLTQPLNGDMNVGVDYTC
jgi:serine/threonine protein kinase